MVEIRDGGNRELIHRRKAENRRGWARRSIHAPVRQTSDDARIPRLIITMWKSRFNNYIVCDRWTCDRAKEGKRVSRTKTRFLDHIRFRPDSIGNDPSNKLIIRFINRYVDPNDDDDNNNNGPLYNGHRSGEKWWGKIGVASISNASIVGLIPMVTVIIQWNWLSNTDGSLDWVETARERALLPLNASLSRGVRGGGVVVYGGGGDISGVLLVAG